jgi:hypothetical protein
MKTFKRSKNKWLYSAWLPIDFFIMEQRDIKK